MSAARLADDFLARMARASRGRATRLAGRIAPAELARRARRRPPAPELRLSEHGFDLIGEVKFVSPAAGVLARRPGATRAAEQTRRYALAGACAVSILTEPTRFGGALAHLRAATRAAGVPVMRKDFLVAPAQVWEARLAGASGVLLVLRMLDDAALAALLEAARAAGLFVLLEAFDAVDLERAARVLDARDGPRALVGVNARDLATLAVQPERHLALARHLPRGVPCVAESGIASAADARAAADAGYALALVGSALMRSRAPARTAAELLAAGRAGARRTP